MRKFIALLLVLLVAIPFAGCNKDTYKIGICQFIQHDALDAATEGFKQAVIDGLALATQILKEKREKM